MAKKNKLKVKNKKNLKSKKIKKIIKKKFVKKSKKLNRAPALSLFPPAQFGVLDGGFLAQSLGILNPKNPICVNESDSVDSVIKILQKYKIGAVLIKNQLGQLTGIFSERDCLLKIFNYDLNLEQVPIAQLMTKAPTCLGLDATIAYALNIMSLGGFRHVPIIDQSNYPIGIISIKDVMDHIVNQATDDLLNFDCAKM